MATAKPARKKVLASPAQKAMKAPLKATRAAKPEPAPAVKNATPRDDKKKNKPEKVKVVRDSFTIPKTEYAQIAAMKKRAMDLGLEVKKSELIRAGLLLLGTTTETSFRKALGNVPTLKTGRPGKG